jgi:hypothetical protein
MELFDVAIEFLANYFDDTLLLELYYKITIIPVSFMKYFNEAVNFDKKGRNNNLIN